MRNTSLAAAGAFVAVLAATSSPAAFAAELTVNISGVAVAAGKPGEIGCSLYADPKGFPMDSSAAQNQWLPADPKGVTCRFPALADGSYAVSVAHDVNGNRKVDTNFLGIPSEAWGVSRNARPSLRAPRFDEAAFKVVDGKDLAIDIKVAK